MKSAAVILIAVCVIAAAGTGIAIAVQDHSAPSGPATYSITYVMDGGVNSSDNPATYTAGDHFNFSEPAKKNFIFTGWYIDSEMTEEITGISKSTTGDITVYAEWEKSSVGTVMNYSIDGSVRSNSFFFPTTNFISGTISYSYLYYTYEKGYMMSYDESYTVTYYNGSNKSFSDSDTYWVNDNEELDWTKNDSNQTISTYEGNKECEVWVGKGSDHTETQYVGVDNGNVYLIQYYKHTIDSTTSITYALTSIGSIDVDNTYEVIAYCDVGISVTGTGTKDAYTDVTLTATASSGTTFSGWYSESGTLLSSSPEYTIDTILSDITIYAMNDNKYDVSTDNSRSVNISPAVPLTEVTWTFEDNVTKTITADTLNYTFSSAGAYTVKYTGKCADGSTYYGIMGILADDVITRTYTWEYDGDTYSTTLDILYTDFMEYRNSNIKRSQGTEAHDLQFVTYDDPYVIELTNDLAILGAGFTDLEMANFILTFTQYIEYQYDKDSMGVEEYWRYPLETLYDQNGDCEDTSILFCAIAKAYGLDCCMILFSGHMAAGVVAEGATGNAFTRDDVTYYYCETTSTGYEVGDYIKQKDIFGREYIVTDYTQSGSAYMNTIPIQ